MSHTLRVPVSKPKEQLLQDAATLLPQNGFTFTPDENGGEISGYGFEGLSAPSAPRRRHRESLHSLAAIGGKRWHFPTRS